MDLHTKIGVARLSASQGRAATHSSAPAHSCPAQFGTEVFQPSPQIEIPGAINVTSRTSRTMLTPSIANPGNPVLWFKEIPMSQGQKGTGVIEHLKHLTIFLWQSCWRHSYPHVQKMTLG